MHNTAPTEATPPRAARSDIAPRSAGRTLKGSGSETNRDYVCRLDPGAGGVPCGLYLVADGGLSAREGERAGACAGEAVRAAFKETCKGPEAAPKLQNSNFFASLLGRARDALIQARNGVAPGEPFTASVVGGYYFDGVFHLGHAGNGAAYLVHGGRIQRLTHGHRITTLDAPSPDPDARGRAPLGLDPPGPDPAASDIPVTSGDSIILCSDGLTDRVDPVTLLEVAQQAASPADAVDLLFEKSSLRQPADDVSVIFISFEKPGEPQTRFIRQIRYPGVVMLSKYVITVALLALLGVMLHASRGILGIPPEPVKTRNIETSPARERRAANMAPAEQIPAARAVIQVQFESTPAGAAVAVDGDPVAGPTPTAASLQPGRAVVTFSKTGYKLLSRVVDIPGDEEDFVIEAALEAAPAGAGDVEIRCAPACDTLHIDGAAVTGVGLPAQSVVRTLSPGAHTILARYRGKEQTRAITVKDGGHAAVAFSFEAERKPAASTQPLNSKKNATPKSAPPAAASRPAPKSSKTADDGVVVYQGGHVDDRKKPDAAASSQTDRPAYVTVEVSTASGRGAGNVKLFKGDRLVAAGAAGSPIRVETGTYNIRVTQDGFEPYQTQKHIAPGGNTMTVFLKRK